jgi:hypothetical protein
MVSVAEPMCGCTRNAQGASSSGTAERCPQGLSGQACCLNVEPSTPAEKLGKKLGFTLAGTLQKHRAVWEVQQLQARLMDHAEQLLSCTKSF